MSEEQSTGSDLGRAFMDALDAQFGYFKGERAIHAKGLGAQGYFEPSGAGAEFTTAPHLQDVRVPVVTRFSNGDGSPRASDGGAFSRGFAVRFMLPDNTHTDLLSIVSPIFITDDPKVFLDFIRALKPDPKSGKPHLLKVAEFAALHPITMGHVVSQQGKEVPASFATTAWHAVHVFPMTNAAGTTVQTRYSWIPVLPAATLKREAAEGLGANYLMDDGSKRLQTGVMEFDLQLCIGHDGDALNRPDKTWKEDHRKIVLGRLTLESSFDADPLCFSPGNLTQGIAPPTDKIFPARLKAYTASQNRRTAAKETS